MATNFKILIHRNTDKFHLKLIGDFDGSSACELLNMMAKKELKKGKVFIQTSGLSSIHPFGKDLFREMVGHCHSKMDDITLTGRFAPQLAFRGSKVC